jgi:hypothetical protein
MKTLSSTHDLASIRGRLARLTPEDARQWGSMTVAQMICHLTDSFGCPLDERPVPPFKASPIPVPIYKWLALNFPKKWPPGVPTPPVMDQQIGGTPPGEFVADHATLLAKLDQFVHSSGPWGSHPIFGDMTTAEWMRWGYLHTNHHLRQFGR